ncbi:hypothetical protein C8F04DRAFT_1277157 [Mycena alexandri]|uniref:Uncharacterized protein n=1 Tax=Mycena alexandri TaxID=1745969 RepID=A0AAD6WN25_9AGAR|nr:hypothetical protein C8F04DRAFT_1277157 [Mycena alexandri]
MPSRQARRTLSAPAALAYVAARHPATDVNRGLPHAAARVGVYVGVRLCVDPVAALLALCGRERGTRCPLGCLVAGSQPPQHSRTLPHGAPPWTSTGDFCTQLREWGSFPPVTKVVFPWWL